MLSCLVVASVFASTVAATLSPIFDPSYFLASLYGALCSVALISVAVIALPTVRKSQQYLKAFIQFLIFTSCIAFAFLLQFVAVMLGFFAILQDTALLFLTTSIPWTIQSMALVALCGTSFFNASHENQSAKQHQPADASQMLLHPADERYV